MRPITILGFSLLAAGSLAQAASCEQQLANGAAPTLVNRQLGQQTKVLCFQGYTVLFSGITRTPLWSAEHLTRSRVQQARSVKRENAFHVEDNLPAEMRSELSDFARSGWDRGHLAPSGDFQDSDSQYESFSLANMIPQNPNNNRNEWEGVESSTRQLAMERGELFVVTGPLFETQPIKRLHGRVMIPTSVFKAVYDPASGQAAAYVTPNAPGNNYETITIAELEQRSGIRVFPSLPAAARTRKMQLPAPQPHGFNSSNRDYSSSHYVQHAANKSVQHFFKRMF